VTRGQALRLLGRAATYAAIILAVVGNLIGLATIMIDHARPFGWDIYADAARHFPLATLSVIDHARPFDWDNYVEAARRFPLGTLYDWHYPYSYHYAPQLAPMLGLLTGVGITAWRAVHFVALALLPSRKLALLLLVSYPFWFDVNTGNLMVFVLLAAAWAYRGNGPATGIYLTMCVLIPRPIMVPLLTWLLWQRPAWRWPFVGMAAVVVVTAIPTGYLLDWIGSFSASGAMDIANDLNLSPSRFIGPAWLIVGLPLAAWLTVRGRLGWASMAVSPYLLPYYVQMLGLELVHPREKPTTSPVAPKVAALPT